MVDLHQMLLDLEMVKVIWYYKQQDINKSAGFTITKVDANNYTFLAAGTATATY